MFRLTVAGTETAVFVQSIWPHHAKSASKVPTHTVKYVKVYLLANCCFFTPVADTGLHHHLLSSFSTSLILNVFVAPHLVSTSSE